jgi:hypothetical protein
MAGTATAKNNRQQCFYSTLNIRHLNALQQPRPSRAGIEISSETTTRPFAIGSKVAGLECRIEATFTTMMVRTQLGLVGVVSPGQLRL